MDGTLFDNDSEEADHLNEVIMAIELRDRGTVGCCYYVAMEEKLYLMEDAKHGGSEVVKACESAHPVILTYIGK
jgi:DNA mismatch repair protein MSH5